MVKSYFLTSAIILISLFSFSQKKYQSWISQSTINQYAYTIDSIDFVEYKMWGCSDFVHRKGKYKKSNDTLYIEFTYHLVDKGDTSTFEKLSFPRRDTIILISDHKISHKFGKSYFVCYSELRKEYYFSMNPSGVINYKIDNFKDSIIIQHMRFNKWETIDSFSNLDTKFIEFKDYNLHPHSGLNKFRICSVDSKSKHTLKYMMFKSTTPKITATFNEKQHIISFNYSTIFELYDPKGILVMHGQGKKIEIADLPNGIYNIFFDNSQETIHKK